jgi:hypothetical protein
VALMKLSPVKPRPRPRLRLYDPLDAIPSTISVIQPHSLLTAPSPEVKHAGRKHKRDGRPQARDAEGNCSGARRRGRARGGWGGGGSGRHAGGSSAGAGRRPVARAVGVVQQQHQQRRRQRPPYQRAVRC